MAHLPVRDRDRLCGLCGRHASFFGHRRGICGICEDKKGKQHLEMIAFKISRDSSIVQLVMDYICEHPKQRMQYAVKQFWYRFLFGDSREVLLWTGHLPETRDADSMDQESDGLFSENLNFCNPLMKLSVSRGRNCPIEIIIDMLPTPPRFATQLPLSYT
jgi:hypothetical protein